MVWPANGEKEEDEAVETLLKRQVRPPKPVGGPLCDDAELLAAFAEGSLAGPAREEFERHLAACAACAEAVARLVRLAPREAVASAPERAKAWWQRWGWAAPVLAGVVLVGSLAWFGRERIRQPQTALEARQQKVEAPVTPKDQPGTVTLAPEAQLDASRQGAARASAGGAKTRAPKATSGEFAPAPPTAGVAQIQPPVPAAPKEKDEAKQDVLAKAEPVGEPAKAMAHGESGAVAGGQLKARTEPEASAFREPKSQVAEEAAGRRDENVVLAPKVMRAAPAGGSQALSSRDSAKAAAAPPAVLQAGVAKRATLKSAAFKPPAEGEMARVQRIGTMQIWVLMADGRLFSSPDGGQSWVQVQAPETLESFTFQDEKSGEIVSRSGERYATGDGGQTWKKVAVKK